MEQKDKEQVTKTPKTPKTQKGGSGILTLLNILMTLIIIGGLGYIGYNNQSQLQDFYKDVVSQFVDMDEFTIVLDDQNFNQVINQYDHVLVEFYAPWCGHCKRLAPEYAKAAQIIQTEFENVRLAKIDATSYKDLANSYQVRGFPTLKWFTKEKYVDYNGGRTVQDIVGWVSRKAGRSSSLIESNEKLQQLKQDKQVIVVYFTQQTEGRDWRNYIEVSSDIESVSFYHVTSEQIAQQNQAQLGQLVIFKQFDELIDIYAGQFDQVSLSQFVNTKIIPSLIPFDDQSIKTIFQSSYSTVLLLHDDNELSKTAREILEKFSQGDLRGKILFAYLTPANQSGHYSRLAEFLGVDANQAPNFIIVDTKHAQIDKYIYKGEINEHELRNYISQFLGNELQPTLKTQEAPETNDEPVKVVVGKNYHEVVINNNKDVLLEFYAPWCGHCKKLAPEYDLAAEKLLVNPNIILAKIDATQNEILGIRIDSFPTIKFFPGNQKSSMVMDYNGDRDTKGIIQWLKQHTTHPWVSLDEESGNDNDQQQQQQQQQQQVDL